MTVKNGDVFYSVDGENYYEYGDAIGCLFDDYEEEDIKPGMEIYQGEAKLLDPADWIWQQGIKNYLNELTEGLGEGAFEEVGECDCIYGYPELPDGALEELEEYLKSFVRKHFTPRFYAIVNVKPYIITADDIAEFKD